ncbi:hypothetical protein HK101_009200 [Irineochytrium annulatum]|nr:hypothetical protein HK101_009200 [Irineochytrium annulatum]
MTFFEKNRVSIWQSLLELDQSEEPQVDESSPSLDDAANVTLMLNDEECVRPALHGVLSAKIRVATLVHFDRAYFVQFVAFLTRRAEIVINNSNNFCSLSVRNLVKRTRVCKNEKGLLKWDQIKHIPLAIVRNRRHPYNLFKITVWNFEANKPTELKEIGSVSFHLHDIIKASPIAGTYDLWNDHMQVGDIDLELTFNYGRFGYGYSYQFKEEDVTPEELVQYSLLPRIVPPRSQREPDEAVMVACATPHPKFIPFRERVYLSYGKEIQDALEEARDQCYRPNTFVKEMSKFETVRDEYFAMPDRVARLMFLRNHLTKSTNQQETTVQNHEIPKSDTYPAKSYTQFVTPISAIKDVSVGAPSPTAGTPGSKVARRREVSLMAGGIIKSRDFGPDDAPEPATSPKSARPRD